MKIIEANDGALMNFEVLDFLNSRGASKDPTRVLVSVSPSEFKVYDYLVGTPACTQTKESINEFLERCKGYRLAKAEVLNLINLRPASAVEIDPIIDRGEQRFGERLEDIVQIIEEVLPPPPTQWRAEEDAADDQQNSEEKKETANEEHIGEDNE